MSQFEIGLDFYVSFVLSYSTLAAPGAAVTDFC